ncbi:MAG: hypothetical protein AB4290_05405 [Spirulina sp.]
MQSVCRSMFDRDPEKDVRGIAVLLAMLGTQIFSRQRLPQTLFLIMMRSGFFSQKKHCYFNQTRNRR